MKSTIIFCFLFICLGIDAQIVPQGYLVNPPGTIGSQIWSTKNLNVTTFRNGNTIQNYTSATGWNTTTSPGMCSYNFDATNDAVYGKLYNYYAASDARGLCPVNWHVPSNAEFQTLNATIGSDGGRLKEKGTSHWTSPNTGAIDYYSFTALPAGYMGTTTPSSQGAVVYFWTTTSYDATHAYTWSLSAYNASFSAQSTNTKIGGFSIRCVHD